MRFLRDNSLTLVLALFFALSILGHALAGWASRRRRPCDTARTAAR